jgi:hypothetical protein
MFIFRNLRNLFFLFIFFSLQTMSQIVDITTNDIVSNIVGGTNSGTIVKNGVTFSITKTGGSTTPLNPTYPTGAPLNTLPFDWGTNIEGLHLGRTWDANGTGWVDEFGQLRTEQYTITFSSNLEALTFIIGAINNNQDGIETLKIVDILNGTNSVINDVSFSIKTDFDAPGVDSLIFDSFTREIKGQDFPKISCCGESSFFSINSLKSFNTILLERKDFENNRPDASLPPAGKNYTNGLTLTGFGLLLANPDIVVKGNNVLIANGDVSPDFADSTNFGNLSHNSTKTITYWIHNNGTDVLNLSGLNPITVTAGEFTITTQPLGTSIAVGDSL